MSMSPPTPLSYAMTVNGQAALTNTKEIMIVDLSYPHARLPTSDTGPAGATPTFAHDEDD